MNLLINKIFQVPFKLVIVTCVGLFIFGMSTTWLITGNYFYEAKRSNALVEFIVANNITGNIQINNWNFTPNWALNAALNYKINQMAGYNDEIIHITKNSPKYIISYDPKESQWILIAPTK